MTKNEDIGDETFGGNSNNSLYWASSLDQHSQSKAPDLKNSQPCVENTDIMPVQPDATDSTLVDKASPPPTTSPEKGAEENAGATTKLSPSQQ